MSFVDKLKNNKLLGGFLDPETRGQFIRYLAVGLGGFILEYALFIVFRMIFDHELPVNIVVTTFIFWFNFLLNKFFSFRSRNNFARQLGFYIILYAINLVVGNILLFSGIRYLLVQVSGEGSWPVLYLPKILIMPFIMSWNFVLYKKVIYK